MQNYCKLIYSNNMLVAVDGDTFDIFGLYIMRFLNKHYSELFSEEASKIIKEAPDGVAVRKKLSTHEKVIFNAEIFKKDDTTIIYFKDVPQNLNPIRDKSEASPFENTVIPYLNTIHIFTGKIASTRNVKVIQSIKKAAFDMATAMLQYLRTVSENNLKNADISFVYADLWGFMREIKSEILGIRNAEIENELLSCFYTHINKDSLTELILSIIKSYTSKGERAYLSCKTLDDGAMIRIANHKAGNFKEAAETNVDIFSLLHINDLLMRNKIDYSRNTYSDGLNEYLLYFKSKRITKVCEDD